VVAIGFHRWLFVVGVASACASAPPRPALDGSLEIRCPAAKAAYVLGTFNDWRSTPVPRPEEGGALLLSACPGLHRAVCELHLADGRLERLPPLNAVRLEPDGFGGENGVFEVEPRGLAATCNRRGGPSATQRDQGESEGLL